MLAEGVCWSSVDLGDSSQVKSKLLADYEHGFCGRGHSVADFYYPKQVHGVEITVSGAATVPDCSDSERTRADALFSQQRGVKIAVQTADCLPLLAATDDFVIAMHAGWRGLFAGILANCAQKLTTHGLHAHLAKWVIGPAISGFNYEVGDELVRMFFAADLALTKEQALTCISRGKRRWHLDLQLACVYGLLNLGVAAKNIEVLRICTYEAHDKFYSYRFAAARTGSNWSFICL